MESSDKTQPSNENTPIWRWLLTIAAVGLFIYQFTRQDTREIFNILKSIPIPSLLAAIVLLMGSRFAVAARWNALLKINDPKPTFVNSLKITFAGLFSGNFLPTSVGGDVVRLMMGKQANLDGVYVTSSLILDRIIGFSGMFFFMPFGLSMWINSPENPFAASGLFLLPFALAFSDIFKKVWESIKKFFSKIWDSLKLWRNNPRYLLEALGYTFLHMFLFFSAMWIYLHALHVDLSFFKMGTIYSLSYVISLFPVSIGSLGIQEMAISYFFSTLGNVPAESAYALALLIRISFLICSIPGVFFLPDLGKRSKNNPAIKD